MKRPVKIGNAIDGVLAGLKAENARRKREWMKTVEAWKKKNGL